MEKKEYIAIKVSNVSFQYSLVSNENLILFSNLELLIKKGEKIGIFGPSGSGKSTFFHLLSNNLTPTTGIIESIGEITLLYQIPQLNPYLTCQELIELEFERCKNGKLNITDIEDYLNKFNLKSYANHLAYHLSGGQKQILSLACGIAKGSDIIIADEPFSNIDTKTAETIKQTFFKTINEFHITFIMSAHFLPFFQGFDRIFEIKDRGLVTFPIKNIVEKASL
ncbi:MAG: Sulfate/thiosulfate import ATP-binding protein CysA [Candidatus Heimdallarchaeota archaeon LC_3]|nr:MAG: Sulfate/thiosulfate import ATP-binding protein CysA [Candidatus Heimdallarchaeota archaeon LC_3]